MKKNTQNWLHPFIVLDYTCRLYPVWVFDIYTQSNLFRRQTAPFRVAWECWECLAYSSVCCAFQPNPKSSHHFASSSVLCGWTVTYQHPPRGVFWCFHVFKSLQKHVKTSKTPLKKVKSKTTITYLDPLFFRVPPVFSLLRLPPGKFELFIDAVQHSSVQHGGHIRRQDHRNVGVLLGKMLQKKAAAAGHPMQTP